MELDEFLYNLHFDIDKVRPVGLEVDWEDAPLPFKLYQGLPSVQLSLDVPLTLGVRDGQTPDVKELGDLCWYSYGLTQLCHALLPFSGRGADASGGETDVDAAGEDADGTDIERAGDDLDRARFRHGQSMHGQSMEDPVMQLMRRYVPSGGGLYPSELYAYLHVEGLQRGVYHYDVAHHRLVLLREGDFDDYMERALGYRIDRARCFATFFVSTMFWKNYYKYHDFAYRLQALDAGALTGQLVEVANRVGYASKVTYQFLDRAINHLMGLNDEEESVYAVISLSRAGNKAGITPKGDCREGDCREGDCREGDCREAGASGFAGALCTELPTLNHRHYVKSQRIGRYPLLVRMNQASMVESTSGFGPLSEVHTVDGCESQAGEGLEKSLLPKVAPLDYDFVAACRDRFSPGLDFVTGHLELEKLSVLLAETVAAASWLDTAVTDTRPDMVVNGVSDERRPEQRVSIGVCVHGIDGLNDGAYIYDPTAHRLKLARVGDHRRRLQSGMSMPTVNFFQVPVCVHLIGCTDCWGVSGYRGYRMQQLEVGMILQRLLLTASALGMNGHPLLGYDESDCDDIYGIKQTGKTCLIEIPVGFYRKTSRFEGPLRR